MLRESSTNIAMTLREVFEMAKRRNIPEGWLYLPANSAWELETEGLLLDQEFEDKDRDEVPLVAKKQSLAETVDAETIVQVVDWADRLAGRRDDLARLDVFRYYCRFDAFPDRLGAPDPPPATEVRRLLDLKYFESLGAERPETKCQADGCDLGAIPMSVFCRRHHFEQIKKRPCPF
jgi:hypothetical protein